MSAVIKIDNVSMMFNLSSEKIDSIKEYIIKLFKRQIHFQEFWALNNVSFELEKGDSLGIIGLNGSGKSTLLKIISGILKPTKGKVFSFPFSHKQPSYLILDVVCFLKYSCNTFRNFNVFVLFDC